MCFGSGGDGCGTISRRMVDETLYCSDQFYKFYYHRKLFLNRVGCKTQQAYYIIF